MFRSQWQAIRLTHRPCKSPLSKQAMGKEGFITLVLLLRSTFLSPPAEEMADKYSTGRQLRLRANLIESQYCNQSIVCLVLLSCWRGSCRQLREWMLGMLRQLPAMRMWVCFLFGLFFPFYFGCVKCFIQMHTLRNVKTELRRLLSFLHLDWVNWPREGRLDLIWFLDKRIVKGARVCRDFFW